MKIGIMGYGIVGKSMVSFLSKKIQTPDLIALWDERELSCDEKIELDQLGIDTLSSGLNTLEEFAHFCDVIIPSAGICPKKYENYAHKVMTEVDFFAAHYQKRHFAVTGALGKTTITNLFAYLLMFFVKKDVVAGGNIGVGLCDVIANQDRHAGAVLELSSFQLQLSSRFSPHGVIFTTFIPNHLDRHETLQNYFTAKWNACINQGPGQWAVVPVQLLQEPYREFTLPALRSYRGKLLFYSVEKPSDEIQEIMVGLKAGFLCYQESIVIQSALFKITPLVNIVALAAALLCEGFDLTSIPNEVMDIIVKRHILEHGQHRMEYCGTINGIEVFNDSKSTAMEATFSAVGMVAQQGKKAVVILGGLSKGVDRTGMIEDLKMHNAVRAVIMLGGDISDSVLPEQYSNLDDVVDAAFSHAQPDDAILFSPGGSSFDLFKNYQDRGQLFKLSLKRWKE